MTDENVKLNEELTSSGLLERLRANDQIAWGHLVHLYSPLVYHWCRKAGLQDADADDVGQEVFRAVAAAISQFRHDRQGDTFRGWLRTVTWNKLRDAARRARKEESRQGGSAVLDQLLQLAADQTPEPDGSAVEEEDLLVYRRATELILSEFEESSRQAFLRVVVDEQAPAAVAAQLGITANAVYLAKSRILRRLHEEFAGLLEK